MKRDFFEKAGIKVCKTLESCETKEQFETADRLLELYQKAYDNAYVSQATLSYTMIPYLYYKGMAIGIGRGLYKKFVTSEKVKNVKNI